jgi:signal transduction histidine kinase
MIDAVMIEHEGVDLVATSIVSGYLYKGEFDDLIDDTKRGVWIGLQPLPAADASQPSRLLVALYPNTGSPSQPDLPRGARQEWRVFELLRVCYEVLNHQLATASDRLAAARRELMVELSAPLVNHEINQQMAIMAENMHLMNQALHGLAPKIADGDPDFAGAARALGRSYDAIARVRQIADAFNNLEKRSPNIEVTPRIMIRECFILMHPRFARAGLAAAMAGNGLDVGMRTDPTLVEHVLLNLMINAVEAIQAETQAAPDPKIGLDVTRINERLVFTIANNGPPIETWPVERIFERGITTKPHNVGHGMGLYLCRLVARYLGGTIDLVEPPSGFTVAFRLELPILPTPSEDIFASMPATPAEAPRTKQRRTVR